MHPIQLSKSDTELFKTIGAIVNDGGEPDIYYFPQYFKPLGNDVYEVLTFDELPEDVKEMIPPHKLEIKDMDLSRQETLDLIKLLNDSLIGDNNNTIQEVMIGTDIDGNPIYDTWY